MTGVRPQRFEGKVVIGGKKKKDTVPRTGRVTFSGGESQLKGKRRQRIENQGGSMFGEKKSRGKKKNTRATKDK